MAQPARVIGPPAAADLHAAVSAWQDWLRDERRASAHTLAAYGRDFDHFLTFLADHLGGPAALSDLARLRVADFRAWLAHRTGTGIGRASNARALAAVRGFFRWAARRGLVDNAALAVLRTPKAPRPVPRPLQVDETEELLDVVPAFARDRWIARRDVAVLLLLYGCGLRIGEALSLRRSQAPLAGQDALVVTGKGRKQRHVPLLPVVIEAIAAYLAACPFHLPPEGPLFVG
ncbi:MAG: recombinase XerC, partial [Alphaproteobacteria bacterium]